MKETKSFSCVLICLIGLLQSNAFCPIISLERNGGVEKSSYFRSCRRSKTPSFSRSCYTFYDHSLSMSKNDDMLNEEGGQFTNEAEMSDEMLLQLQENAPSEWDIMKDVSSSARISQSN